MNILASIALRLQQYGIDTIRVIINLEHPDLCVGQTSKENHGAATSKEALEFSYCPVCKLFARVQSLNGSIMFMNPKVEIYVEGQLNCLHRV